MSPGGDEKTGRLSSGLAIRRPSGVMVVAFCISVAVESWCVRGVGRYVFLTGVFVTVVVVVVVVVSV